MDLPHDGLIFAGAILYQLRQTLAELRVKLRTFEQQAISELYLVTRYSATNCANDLVFCVSGNYTALIKRTPPFVIFAHLLT